jgi:hypothetical protein
VKSLGSGGVTRSIHTRPLSQVFLSDIIADARSAVRMAVCSYCQRIKPFRPVKAVVVDASGIKSWSSSFDQYIATRPMRSRRPTSHIKTAY